MRKEEFNKMSLDKQVEYINSQLPLKTLTMVCKEINVPRSTLSSKFNRNGYKLDLEQNKYIQEQNSRIETPIDYPSDEIKELLEMKENLKGLLEWYKEQKDKGNPVELNIPLEKFDGEAVSRTFVLYANVLDKYLEFCDRHKEYRRQDIFSKALVEFLDKYA